MTPLKSNKTTKEAKNTEKTLLASAATMGEIKALIARYWYTQIQYIELEAVTSDLWVVLNNKKTIHDFFVVFKKDRYRFEYVGKL